MKYENSKLFEGLMPQIQKLILLACILSIFFTVNIFAQSNDDESINKSNQPITKVLVVIYSSSGNTKAVANEIVELFDADTVVIKAEEYEGFWGGFNASDDAWDEVKTTKIIHEYVDMDKYNLVFLGSPIWWYRPAVPLWTFIEKNNFDGKKVVLFNTFNSKFEQKFIDEFKNIIVDKGGDLIDHIYIRRGRWYSQLDREELLTEFGKLLDKNLEKWQKIINK